MKSALILIAAAAIPESESAGHVFSKTMKSKKGGKSSKSGLFSKSGKNGKAEAGAEAGGSDGCEGDFYRPNFGAGKTNPCENKKIEIPNAACYDENFSVAVGGQAGADVTVGKKGLIDVDFEPVTSIFNAAPTGMCPVNVHWHLGAEHRSEGQYDESFDAMGPEVSADGEHHRNRALAGDIRQGFRCGLYDEEDAKFKEAYHWKYCENMHVGETYEVHWPHSAAGACGTIWQYQTNFYHGVFCNIPDASGIPEDLYNYVGVQSQVFTVVNDEEYFYPDLMRGMIVDAGAGMGGEITKYTGSTTGDSRNNDDSCSQYKPITWQVDRKCHMISASSFDKMCFDMLNQADDMQDDVHPHGAREVVDEALTDNNQVWDRRKKQRALRNDTKN